MNTNHIFIALISILTFLSCKDTQESKFQFDSPKDVEAKSTTYYFVRHAEKNTTDLEDKDPHLTEEGLKRANYLQTYFADKNLEMFYSTDYNRTIQTLIPTIHHFKGEMMNYDGSADTLFTRKFWEETYGKNVLVVGHSNTNPRFVNEILQNETYEELDESNYDVFFKVEIDEELNIRDSLITKRVPENFSYNSAQ